MAASSCFLYCSSDSSLSLIDIPRSIEQAQGASLNRILSTEPQEIPFPSLEPKSAKAKASAPTASVEDLLLSKRLEFALQELGDGYHGPRCLPRRVVSQLLEIKEPVDRKRRKVCLKILKPPGEEECGASMDSLHFLDTEGSFFYHNPRLVPITIHTGQENDSATVPPRATALSGNISATLPTFISTAPKFSVVVLDPPWPNRSARRVKSYGIAYDTPEIHRLLASIPLEDHLTDDGMIAVWITNKAAFREMVAGEAGLFEQWGVNLTEEWIWLKTTKSGEAICALDSTWRKPYEVLLVGQRNRAGVIAGEIKRRVIVGVPDLHSRKPNLKNVFEKFGMTETSLDIACLEIFARNLTAGWWGWGNEVLKFQMEDCWNISSASMQSATDSPQDR